ncbi:MAG: peptidylprolyl isomerase, partial [bacterium]|nr:peptidylprolyl isomerase [bacterium]
MDNIKPVIEEEKKSEQEKISKPNNEQANLKMFLIGLAVIIAVGLVTTASVGVYRAYAKGTGDKFTTTVATILRLPAMKINGQSIQYSEYADDLKAIHTLREYDKKTNGQSASATDEQLSDQVLWRLVNTVLIKQGALNYNVKVEQTDIDALKTQMLSRFKDTGEAEIELRNRYGWGLDDYEKKVMRTFVLQSKLSDIISSDQKAREVIRNQASEVLAKIKAGTDFAEMAKQYGSDGTKDAGGDLGFFAKGEMVPEFETAAFALKPGTLNEDLVETSYGYHIIKTTEKKTEKVKNTAGKMENVEKVRASHILFRFPTIEQYLDQLSKQATIHLYAKVHNPFLDL